MASRVVRRGGTSVGDAANAIRRLPVQAAIATASAVAPALTTETRADFSGGRTVYGDARPASVDGGALSLVKSGATQAALAFAATGTRIRAVLPTKYAKYLIGKYRILPPGRAAMPAAWKRLIASIAQVSIGRLINP